jgi:serine/threonine protein kinase
MILHSYKIIEPISNGSFGQVYKGIHIRTNKLVAIKIETNVSCFKTLKHEAKIYSYLHKLNGFPNLKWFGNINNTYYLVTDYLGPSLTNFSKNISWSNDRNILLNISIQLIERIQTLHTKKLIHRDIKSDNFLVTNTNNNTLLVYIIDFGFCISFLNNNFHISLTNNNSIIGSPNYISINIHNGLTPSRRDDLESIIYIILELYFGKLPWANTIDISSIYNQKNKIYSLLPPFLQKMIKYISNLKFSEKPNYNFLIHCLQQEIIC